ncbi:hypothetical protein [Halomonas borealis]|nr:hypothetical protein [Halomonas borealis]
MLCDSLILFISCIFYGLLQSRQLLLNIGNILPESRYSLDGKRSR